MKTAERATSPGTARYFERFRPSFSSRAMDRTLGKTDLHFSPVGFGGYRISEEVPSHHEALRAALLSGCNLIDTSSNYTNGGSEKLVGDVLAELFMAKKLSRDEVVVVTKAGYVQGDNMELAQRRIQEGKPFPEMVEYAKECWHCISPEFLEDQITRSLERLQLDGIDVLLLHNPEYFLKVESDHREYYRRIFTAFEYLESEVKRGRIQYYGISSNTFPSPRESEQYTSLETVWELAEKIENSHFAVIQFPMNLFEPGAALEENNSGETVLQFAWEKNLGTLINRPLNSFSGDRLVRLADFPSHDDKDIAGDLKSAWSRAMELESAYSSQMKNPPLPAPQLAWGHILKQNFQRLQEIDTWNYTLQHQIEPSLSESLALLEKEPEFQDWVRGYREVSKRLFEAFTAYLENQASHQSDLISSKLDHACPELHTTQTLSQKVLRLYHSLDGVDCVLVGMRQSDYVRDALSWEAPVSNEEALNALRLMQ